MQAERSAEQVLRRQRRQRVEAETVLARRLRYANKDHANKRRPKIVMNQRRTEAQVSAGKLRGNLDDDVTTARDALAAASARVRDDAVVRVQLADPGVPAGRRLAELHGADRTVVLQGPERVALIGPNGVGKTTMLDALMRSGSTTERVAYLPQRLDGLDDDATVLEQVRAAAPDVPPQEVRAQLARFLLSGDDVHRPVGTLSGGERFRVALARLLLADPPPQLLVLDEPTNDLDLQTTDQLVAALAAYRGGLLVVSHDDAFLRRLGITTWLALDPDGRLRDAGPPAGRT